MTDVVLVDPFAAGIVRWWAPASSTALVVKATFLVGDAPEPHLTAPDPLCIDAADPSGDGLELLHASDFVPAKARVDLLLTGHAAAPAPTTRHPVRLACEGWERRLVATSAEPTTHFPLLRRHLREGTRWDGAPAAACGVAPRDPSRVGRAGVHPLAPDGWPEGPLDASFDPGFFNAAPQEQQLASIPPWLWIEGVFPGSPVRALWLGGRWPFALAVRHDGGTEELAFVGDTIAIDVDRSVVSLVWRARIDPDALARVAIALGHLEDPPTEEDLVIGMGGGEVIPLERLATYVAPPPAMVRQDTAHLDGFAVVPDDTRDIVVATPGSAPLPFAPTSAPPVDRGPSAGAGAAFRRRSTAPPAPYFHAPGAAPIEATPFARASLAPPATPSLLAPPLAPPPPAPPPPAPPPRRPQLATIPDEPPWAPAPPAPAPLAPPGAPPPPRSRIARYAAARAAIEADAPTRDAAVEHGFAPAEWEKQHRAMLRKARLDPSFERELTAAMAEARRAHARAAADRAARGTTSPTSSTRPRTSSLDALPDGAARRPRGPGSGSDPPRDPVA